MSDVGSTRGISLQGVQGPGFGIGSLLLNYFGIRQERARATCSI